MTDQTRLIKNFLSLLSLRGLEFLIPLLTLPYLLRTIGVDNYGLVGFGYSFALYFGAITQYGFGVTATRDIARNRQDHDAVSHLYSTILATSTLLALAAVSIALLIVLMFSNLRDAWVLHALSLAHVMVQSMFPVWFFQGMERMAFIAYLNLVSKVAFLVGLFLVVHTPNDYIYVPLLNLIAASMVLGGSMWIVRNLFHVRIRQPGWSAVRKTLVTSRHAFLNQLAPNLYNNSATFMLGLFSGSYAVGLYTAVTKVVDAVSSLGYVISNTFLPYLSRSIGSHRLFKRIMLSTGLVGSLGLFLGADLIGNLLHPTEGAEIAKLLRLACVSVFMVFAILTFGSNYLMLTNKETISSRITLFTSMMFFLAALYLVPQFGLFGALATLVGARSVMAVAHFFAYRATRS